MIVRLPLFLLACLAAAASAPVAGNGGSAVVINAKALPYIRTTDERFQSYQIGFSHLTGGETWKAYDAMPAGSAKDFSQVREPRAATDLRNPRLRNLTSALAPLYIRYSGTTANSVYFHNSDTPLPSKVPDGFTVMLSRERWKQAVAFARSVNAKVVTSFAVSEGVRDAQHGWTPAMASGWLSYTRSIGGHIYAAELFNEPNAPEPPRLPRGFTAQEYARDYATFSAFMAKAAPTTRLAGPGNATLGVGGVAAIGGTSAEQYAAADPNPRFGIVSYHFYPVLAQRCAPANSPLGLSADQALSEEFLARPDRQFQEIKALRDSRATGAPIWLTETGGAACGGLVWQPTFLDTFRYLDTHARLAKQGLDAIFTHALISGSNGVIDEKTLEPNASYWAAVLWRRLMGPRVLDAGPSPKGLHIYAHCLRGKSGGVALLALNLSHDSKVLDLPGTVSIYALSAPELQSRTVLLNGKPLVAKRSGKLPSMTPVTARGSVVLAPTSSAFIALPHVGNAACQRGTQ